MVQKLINFGRSSVIHKYIALVLIFVVSFFFNLNKSLYKKRYKLIAASLVIVIFYLYINYFNSFNKFILASESIGINENGELLFSGEIDENFNDEFEPIVSDHSNEPEVFVTDIEKQLAEFDPTSWNLIIVNKDNYLPEGYMPELSGVNGYKVDSRIVENVNEMLESAKEDGINLKIDSAFRDNNTQSYLFNKKYNQMKRIYTDAEEAKRIAATKVAIPGSSEHETGLALDILTNSHYVMDAEFGETNEGKWLAENAYKFGFILRYPVGKEEITGIQYEPWHFRYVGYDAALFIKENDITFEEFYSLIENNL